MSDAIFPVLPGLTWDVKRSPEFSTTMVRGADGGETRIGNWVYPLWHWTLTYELLRDDATDELKTLLGFFLSRQGKLDDFLFDCVGDNAVTGQGLGVGDGSTVAFPCVRAYGAFVEPVKALKAAPVIKVAGVAKTIGADYSVSATGVVTFVAAPPVGAAVTADFSYYWRVRFDIDAAEFNQFAQRFWDLRECTLVSVR